MTTRAQISITNTRYLSPCALTESGRFHEESAAQVLEGPVAHATGRRDGRQEGCECGYYHLHRNLNQASLFHDSSLFIQT